MAKIELYNIASHCRVAQQIRILCESSSRREVHLCQLPHASCETTVAMVKQPILSVVFHAPSTMLTDAGKLHGRLSQAVRLRVASYTLRLDFLAQEGSIRQRRRLRNISHLAASARASYLRHRRRQLLRCSTMRCRR